MSETPAETTETADSNEQTPATRPTETVEFWKQKAREQEKRAKENAHAQQRLTELEAANLTELEKAQNAAKDATARLAEYERTVVKQRIALNKGLPPDLVDRLRGDTEADLEADADSLLELVNARQSPRPDPSQGARAGDANASTGQQFASAVEGMFTT